MRILFYLFLIFYSQISYAENKSFSSVNIAGISLFDSVFDYFTYNQIRQKSKAYKNYFQHLDKPNLFTVIGINHNKKFNQKYESLEIGFKFENEAPIIHNIRGIDFYDNIKLCYEDLFKIAKYISTKHPNLKKTGPLTVTHPADPSEGSKYTGFKFENAKKDSIKIVCYDWSDKISQSRNWQDNFSYTITSYIFERYLGNLL